MKLEGPCLDPDVNCPSVEMTPGSYWEERARRIARERGGNCVFFPRESVKCCSISSPSPNRSSNSRTRTGCVPPERLHRIQTRTNTDQDRHPMDRTRSESESLCRTLAREG